MRTSAQITPSSAGTTEQPKVSDLSSSRRRSSSERKTVLIGVHCTPKMAAQVDAFIARQEFYEMSRPAAIRLLLSQYLKEMGF